jgi:hypothetical protein
MSELAESRLRYLGTWLGVGGSFGWLALGGGGLAALVAFVILVLANIYAWDEMTWQAGHEDTTYFGDTDRAWPR